MNPNHDPHTGKFASKAGGGGKGSGVKSAGKKPKAAGGGGSAKPASRGKFKSLTREGNVSVRGGSSKPIVRVVGGAMKEVGTRTVFSADSLRATLKRTVGAGKNPYAAVTIITQRGAFQGSVGKKMFHGGSSRAQGLARPSIGQGFGMTPRKR